MTFGYARVSTKDQILDRQLLDLKEYGCDRIYTEKKSGTEMNKRTELERLLDNLRPGDKFVVCDLTRLSRSLKDLFTIANRVSDAGADLISLKEQWLDTSTPAGKMMFTIFACLSEFERDIISQNTREGLQSARLQGRYNGRPPIDKKKAEVILQMRKAGISTADIATATGIARTTVYNYINAEKEKNEKEESKKV